ncbi:hypothetical protein S40285_10123 [Stachybotrys chlorohalonatus IBT 40285]|uniref:Uncharacterized protein n=1 Tax=Stachybotrys chlorohalonatus (strain IBT 40285) TaxID=1283841 RepID=A0A084QBU2_STAC4|nr:hypothetical protein S40285_10123 [Stachybotrys chlorohalonata IBT 40285]
MANCQPRETWRASVVADTFASYHFGGLAERARCAAVDVGHGDDDGINDRQAAEWYGDLSGPLSSSRHMRQKCVGAQSCQAFRKAHKIWSQIRQGQPTPHAPPLSLDPNLGAPEFWGDLAQPLQLPNLLGLVKDENAGDGFR